MVKGTNTLKSPDPKEHSKSFGLHLGSLRYSAFAESNWPPMGAKNSEGSFDSVITTDFLPYS